MKVNAVPTIVQAGQLEPIRITAGPVLFGFIVGPAHVVKAYWLPEESFT